MWLLCLPDHDVRGLCLEHTASYCMERGLFCTRKGLFEGGGVRPAIACSSKILCLIENEI